MEGEYAICMEFYDFIANYNSYNIKSVTNQIFDYMQDLVHFN